MMVDRKIAYEYVSRVEGQGSLEVCISGSNAVEVRFEVFEPPRFFEAFVKGRNVLELPELTARICGVCPIAHAITAAKAIENALKVSIDEETVTLRKALALSGIMQSHALHIYFLAAPDYLGYPSAIAASKDLEEVVLRGLRLKRVANMVSEWIGGRSVHPVTLVVGGLSRPPPKERLYQIRESLNQALEDAVKTVELVSGFNYPDFEPNHIDVALSGRTSYPIIEGGVGTSSGQYFDERTYRGNVVEEQVPYSNTKRSRLKEGGSFEVGPTARFNLNYSFLCDGAKEAAEKAGLKPPVMNPFKATVVRAVEVVQAIEEMQESFGVGVAEPPSHTVRLQQGSGAAVTEAPRGLLYHAYTMDKEGKVLNSDIVTPTAHNAFRIEEDIREFTPTIVHLDDEAVMRLYGMLIRAYDPCISCSVHAFNIKVLRR